MRLAWVVLLAACSGGGGGTRSPTEPKGDPPPETAADAAPAVAENPGPDPQYMEPLQRIVGNFELPSSLDVNIDDCGATDARYDPNIPQILVCTELITALGTEAAHLAFHHQLGHALLHLLELPATGPEEVSIDQLSIVLAVHFTPDVLAHFTAALGTPLPQTTWSDNHALDAERARNMLCLIQGATEKSGQCAASWNRTDAAWLKLLDVDVP
jgi:hypothetical protein